MTLRRRQQITARTVLPKPRHRHRRRTSVGAVAATTVIAATVVAASGVVSSGALTGSEGTVATTSYARHFAAASVMLADRAGFGRSTTGGYLGRMIHVTTAADDGPGSLRAAVAGSTPAWVVFDDDFKIRLAKGLEVGSNKTIDGRGRHVTITGHGTDGLIIDGVSNVIVSNLTLTDFGDVALTKDNDKPDAIHVRRAKNVWIDHNDLSVAGDKLISIDNGSAGVTVSWNHFHDQQQVFQIGSQLTAKAAARQRVTVHHNFFDRTGYRNPVLSYGKAHVYNNYVYGWSVYGVRSQRHAQLYLERNVFQATKNLRASDVTPGRDGCNDDDTQCDARLGYLAAVGNLLLDGATLTTNEPSRVFSPSLSYAYTAQPASQSLVSDIKGHAGPR